MRLEKIIVSSSSLWGFYFWGLNEKLFGFQLQLFQNRLI